MELPATRDLVASLASKTCPACGGAKNPRHTFCSRDYYVLPPDLRTRLYNRVGDGYAEAVSAALVRLGRREFIRPPAPPTSARPLENQLQMFGSDQSRAFRK